VDIVKFHYSPEGKINIASPEKVPASGSMAERGEVDLVAVARRLRALQQAIGAMIGHAATNGDMAGWAGVEESAWSNYIAVGKDYAKLMPVPAALALRKRWGVALDWIYDGDGTRNEPNLAREIDKALRHPKAVKMGRRPLQRVKTS
jgi:hypothetical protein